MIRRALWVALALGILYFGAVRIARAVPQGILAWTVYAPWIPIYDIVDGPRQALRERGQHAAAGAFLTRRLRTGPTVQLCPRADAEFRQASYDRLAMVNCFVAQNSFGAITRQEFIAYYHQSSPTEVLYIELADGTIIR